MKRAIATLVAAVLLGGGAALASGPFELADGDRIVLIGGTLIERDQSHGYLETRLVRRHPGLSLTFRNLGWSGDTVEGISRARFGTQAEGFQHLVDHALALRPTVIVLGYGGNEAFDGPAGLPAFRSNLDKLLDALAPSKARLVFLAPNPQEDLGRPLPDPAAHNADLALYRDALKAEAGERGGAFVDLFGLLKDVSKEDPREGTNLTGNGIHFTPYGYWYESAMIEGALLGEPAVGPSEDGREPGKVAVIASLATVKDVEMTPSGVRFKLLGEKLPGPGFGTSDGLAVTNKSIGRSIKVVNLAPGRYALKVDGKPIRTAGWEMPPNPLRVRAKAGLKPDATAESWNEGVLVFAGPEFDQVEALRAAINAKNELYFHRWRPENETYLFGFRKHEQGRNAAEIVEFDPLIAAKEAEIARLRVPVAHVYELTREGEVGR